MKKTAVFLSALLALCAFGGCGGKEEVDVISRIATNEYGVTYLEVDGKPFHYFGVESRLDAYMNCENQTVEDFEAQFVNAKALGANVLAVPVDWRDVEPEKGLYDFSVVGTLLSFSVKYDVKLDLLWYSINMCGESNSYQVPDYIWTDEETYPKYDSLNKGAFWSYYGEQGYLKASKALLKRESLVIGELMDFVYQWDLNNGETHPLIGVQVYNEPDTYPNWRVAQQQISDGGKPITPQEAWADVCKAIDNAGKAFKRAKYNVVTRVNCAKLKGATDYAVRLFNLDGIDCVGNDPYITSVGGTYNLHKELQSELPGNFAHCAENKGSYKNTASLLLTSAYCGAGYIIYDLSTAVHFIENRGDSTLEEIDHGVLNPDGTDKAHTESVRRTLKALVGAGDCVLLGNKADFAVFNLEESTPETECFQSVNTTGVSAAFETAAGAVGFAIVYQGYVYLFASELASIELGNADFSGFSYGAYFGGEWKEAGASVLVEGNKVTLENGLLCRAKVENIRGELVSNTKNYIGG
ncbi:MAG: DUF4978 domain-containing protein [Clostridia bacterium]|nr:DUF4978 domain-containing protein [Clostridia bacterium]